MRTCLVGIDVGTTHCKVGLFASDGTALRVESRPVVARREGELFSYDPREVWGAVATSLANLPLDGASVAGVGISSMAETGLLLDRRTGEERTALLPWFDTRALAQAERIAGGSDPLERFRRSGLRVRYKAGLAKLLWLREKAGVSLEGAVWLSAADYVAYRLTGELGTDYTLAARTLAFDLPVREWDAPWIRRWGFAPELFPPARPSATIVGHVAVDVRGISRGTPVVVAGHDHVCAAFAAGAIEPGVVFDSMGTAETLVGALPERPLREAEYRSGFMYGAHVVPDRLFWMGGTSASGGSVEWLRELLGREPLEYGELEELLEASPGPTGILYFPYLSGSGTPHSDAAVTGALVGLERGHGRASLARAVLEGVAYELEFIRREAEGVVGAPIETLVAAGGGTRNAHWMRVKADISGCRFELLPHAEATLLGAAMVAGLGSGVYADAESAVAHTRRPGGEVYEPDPAQHAAYRPHLRAYLAFQGPLRRHYHRVVEVGKGTYPEA